MGYWLSDPHRSRRGLCLPLVVRGGGHLTSAIRSLIPPNIYLLTF